MLSVNFNFIAAGTDWTQFVPSLIATVFGFILAIIFQQLVYEYIKNKISDARKAKELVMDIKKECEKIIYEIDKLEDKLYVDPIKTPVMEGILNNNEIQILAAYKIINLKKAVLKSISKNSGLNKEQLKNIRQFKINLYEKIFTVYDAIYEYNKWWNIYTDRYLSDSTDDKLKQIQSSLNSISETLHYNGTVDSDSTQINKSAKILMMFIRCTIDCKDNAADADDIQWLLDFFANNKDCASSESSK